MNAIRKTVFAAATVAVAFGAMGTMSNADAGNFRFNLNLGGHHGGFFGHPATYPCGYWAQTYAGPVWVACH